MKILLLNPNTTAEVTGLLYAAGVRVASSGTEIVTATAQRGVPYIATRAEAQIGGAIALEMLAEVASGIDAAIIAAFGDPGLFGARELFDFPVIGLAEAAMLTACMVGRRFAIVTFSRTLAPWYRECVAMHGLEARCVGIRALDEPFRSIAEVQAEKEERLVRLANLAVEQDEADVVILSGAPLAGLADKVSDRIPVPLIDPIAAAVRQAETLATLKPRKAVAGTFRRPDPKPTKGLAAPLAAVIEHRELKQGETR
ncbi:MAG TPA: aspartate/glutamate racemase family protein [Bradyrhizobium sp.]|nr:aspartate/glutamate racemase family protein [Bradyrhizobium sp.]